MNLLNKIFNAYSKDTSKMLLVTGAFGWMLSSLGQILGIANNKKISKKEKEFLIPQEIADAAINILSYVFVTLVIQNQAKRLVSKGKIITPRIKEVCQKYGIQIAKNVEGKSAKIGDAISEKIEHYKSVLNLNEGENLTINPDKIKTLQSKLDELEKLNKDTYSPLEGGVGVVGNVIGTILSSNIITPIIRNPMASWKQKSALDRQQLEHDAKLYHENKVILAQNSYGMDAYRTRVTTPGGGMKI